VSVKKIELSNEDVDVDAEGNAIEDGAISLHVPNSP
jgi:hypothetical protein